MPDRGVLTITSTVFASDNSGADAVQPIRIPHPELKQKQSAPLEGVMPGAVDVKKDDKK